jgi:DNA-binding IscR family transcriptional regulator
MAKLSDLVSRSAEITGVPRPTVQEVSRRLREANLIQTGKGGRYGGAAMTPQDAASLLTALMIVRTSAPSMRTVAQLTRSHLRELKSYSGRWRRDVAPPQLYRLKPTHTFGDAFSALLASIAEGDLENTIKEWAQYGPFGTGFFFDLTVNIGSLLPFPEASIEFQTPAFDRWTMSYYRPRDKKNITPLPRRWSEGAVGWAYDLQVSATIREPTLKSIGLLLRTETEHV